MTEQGKETASPDEPTDAARETDPESGALPALPDLLRRVLGVGFSGFFLTEAAIRKALGDTLPRDWIDFAVEQSDRTRAEFIERLSYEVVRSLESADLGAALATLLEGRTLEVKAEIRLAPKQGGSGETGVQVLVNRKTEER